MLTSFNRSGHPVAIATSCDTLAAGSTQVCLRVLPIKAGTKRFALPLTARQGCISITSAIAFLSTVQDQVGCAMSNSDNDGLRSAISILGKLTVTGIAAVIATKSLRDSSHHNGMMTAETRCARRSIPPCEAEIALRASQLFCLSYLASASSSTRPNSQLLCLRV